MIKTLVQNPCLPLTTMLSVVAPCFNELESLLMFHERVSRACMDTVGQSYEIVLVDDGSTDGTWDLMLDLSGKDPHVIAIKLSRNYGHQIALSAGLQFCRGAKILVIDADLQDPPELLPLMLAKMDAEKADVVFGQRQHREGETYFKTITAAAFYRLLRRLTEINIPIDTGDFRLMTRRVLKALNEMPEHHRFIRGMVSWIGMRQVPILYVRDERFAGVTKYPFSKMLRFGMDAITGFSVTPLRLASCLGVLLGFVSIAMLAYTLGSWALGHVVEGWTSLTTIVLVIGSVQLVVMGVLGEYLGRIYMESKQRPLFIVDQVAQNYSPQSDDRNRALPMSEAM